LNTLTLGESWDPYKTTLRLLNGEYDISVEDMLNEPIEIYEMRKPKVFAKRGRAVDDPQTVKRPKVEDAGQNEEMKAEIAAAAIKRIIIGNVRTLNEEQRTEAKAMICWNQLARELTMWVTENKHQGSTIEEGEITDELDPL
jgi:hypothetical protein